MFCTPGRSKKVVVARAVVALTAQAIVDVVWQSSRNVAIYVHMSNVKLVIFHVILPMTVLVINVTVVCAVRRAANSAAANLGQQSTSSSSTVPTVMLVSTSLVYVLLCGTDTAVIFVHFYTAYNMTSLVLFTEAFHRLIYAYNFYVYLITGKQFRLELRKLFHCCTPPHHAAAAERTDGDTVRQPTRDQSCNISM